MTSDWVGLPDVNVLLASHVQDHEHHSVALKWLENTPAFALCPITESGLLRLLLNPYTNPSAISISAALKIVCQVRQDRRAQYWREPVTICEPNIDLGGISGYRQITDIYLVMIAKSSGGRLVTFDKRLGAALHPRDRTAIYQLPSSP